MALCRLPSTLAMVADLIKLATNVSQWLTFHLLSLSGNARCHYLATRSMHARPFTYAIP